MRQGRTILSLGLCVAALAACDGGSPVERGFGSRQLLSIRDSTLTFNGQLGGLWLFSVGGEFWSLDLDTGEARNLGSMLPELAPPPSARYQCQVEGQGAGYSVTVTNTQSGEKTVIDRLAAGAYCPSDSDPTITAWRQDDEGNLTLWTGPYNQLAFVPLELIVQSVMFGIPEMGTSIPGFWVYGARPSQPDGLGMFAIDAPDFTVREIIPPAIGTAAWAPGATPEEPALDSTSLSNRSSFSFAGHGHFSYGRIMSDGGTTMFVGPFSSGPSELALFRLAASARVQAMLLTGFDGLRYLRPVWRSRDVATAADTFISWNERWQRLTTCPSTFPDQVAFTDQVTVSSDPDDDWLAFTVPIDPLAYRPPGGPLLLMGSGACTTLATADVTAFSFSPDGTATAWLVQPPSGDATLWTAGRDGSAPRMVGAGDLAGPPHQPHFVGPAELQLQLGRDLAWIDVHDSPVRMHYIAEQVFGTTIDIGGGWLVTGYERSGQDATGAIGLVNRHTGTKRLISREVATFDAIGPSTYLPTTTFPPSSPGGGAGLVRILYVVRGRNPSPQDGLWIATINEDDLN